MRRILVVLVVVGALFGSASCKTSPSGEIVPYTQIEAEGWIRAIFGFLLLGSCQTGGFCIIPGDPLPPAAP